MSMPLRVLIVEDVEDDALLVLRELARGPYDVTHRRVETGDALTEALRAESWDLLISDYALPRLTAMDVLTILRATGLDLPCIIISGTIEEEAAVDALRMGARDFIVKGRLTRLLPAVARELREAIERRRRREAEQALGNAEQRMRYALEAAGVGIWEIDIVSRGAVCSDVWKRLHGRPEGTIRTYESFLDVIHADDRERVRTVAAESLRDHTELRVEYRVTWADGSIRWIAASGQGFYDHAGQPVRAAGVAMDITVQKNLEEQFRQAQRMESIGNLAGGIAHDFNNLLTAILGYSNVLIDDADIHHVPEQMKNDLDEIRKAGERAAALTSQLLAFSRRQIIQPTILNINTVVQNIETMLRRLIGEQITLTTRLSADLGSTRADVGQVEQVIMNLVVNARDAMPEGGKITIETANVDLDDGYTRSHIEVAPGLYAMLAVSDTGAGMSAAVQARIFEPFFTTKPQGQGTGLGLATIYGIVKQNSGNIWVYSEPDKGSVFKVYLPLVEGTAASVAHPTKTQIRLGIESILLAEDDAGVRTLVHNVLTRTGYTVIAAQDADDALRLAAEHAGHIDLLLTDVVMPGTGGRRLAEQLAERHAKLKVLYMSGYTDNAIVHHGVLAPGVAFLQKPFTPASLVHAVRDVLDKRT